MQFCKNFLTFLFVIAFLPRPDCHHRTVGRDDCDELPYREIHNTVLRGKMSVSDCEFVIVQMKIPEALSKLLLCFSDRHVSLLFSRLFSDAGKWE